MYFFSFLHERLNLNVSYFETIDEKFPPLKVNNGFTPPYVTETSINIKEKRSSGWEVILGFVSLRKHHITLSGNLIWFTNDIGQKFIMPESNNINIPGSGSTGPTNGGGVTIIDFDALTSGFASA